MLCVNRPYVCPRVGLKFLLEEKDLLPLPVIEPQSLVVQAVP
jgi:hypothetical protein